MRVVPFLALSRFAERMYNGAMVALSVDIPEEPNAQIQEICRRQNCTPDEALRKLLRHWGAVEQFRKDASEVRRLAEAAGFTSEKDIFEPIS